MNYFLCKDNARYCTIVAATLQLWACGGGGESPPQDTRPNFDDTAVSTTVSNAAVYPVSHIYAVGGTYTLTVTGTYTLSQFVNPDTLRVWFSFSGQGTATGAGYPTYVLDAANQVVTVSQTINVTMTGDGPWQMAILCFTGTAVGTMSDLKLHSVLN